MPDPAVQLAASTGSAVDHGGEDGGGPPPMWLLAGEEEDDFDEPCVCRGFD